MAKLPSVTDYIVQDNLIEGEYKEYLHRSLFDVNIRLYHSSKSYKCIVDESLNYLASMFLRKFRDYSKIKGVSGANLGIPFNIIAIKRKNDDILVMVNPEILIQEGKTKKVASNCGSLVLDDPVEVIRRTKIKVGYYETVFKGNDYGTTRHALLYCTEWFEDSEAFTIQHEVDHNNGITILDRQAPTGELS